MVNRLPKYSHPVHRITHNICITMKLSIHNLIGFSILKLITEGLSDKKSVPENAIATYAARGYFASIVFRLTLPFMACYDAAKIITSTLTSIPLKPSRDEEDWKLIVDVGDKIPIQRIKDVKNHFKVSFGSVISAICAGALRDIMILKGIKVPPLFQFGSVLPLPEHTEKLRNYM